MGDLLFCLVYFLKEKETKPKTKQNSKSASVVWLTQLDIKLV
jgi:hypothetical protein